MGHMLKFFECLDDLGAQIVLHGHQRPVISAGTVRELFQRIQEEERKVTAHIVEAITLARAENSFETDSFLEWFPASSTRKRSYAARSLTGSI